jgi:hypothetical protein
MVVRAVMAAVAATAVLATPGTGAAQQGGGQSWDGYELEARIWLDRGAEPVLQRGERVRVYYRVSEDANVAIFHVNTDGTVRLVVPRSPRENQIVNGARDYRVLFPETSYWFVDDYAGIGYFFIVASPSPLDLSLFPYSYYDGGWDLSQVGRQVYTDPYEAIDDYVAALVPDWETAAYGLDFTSYHVGEHQAYPRFLCYDCHGFTPFYAWNPYYYACTSFRVVVYNDPFYYPTYRYGGGAVVYPARRHQPRFVFKERARGEPGTPLLTTRAEAADVDQTERRRTPGTEPSTGVPSADRVPRATEGRAPGTTRIPTRATDPDFARPGERERPIVVPWPGRATPPDASRPPARGGDARATPTTRPTAPPSGTTRSGDEGRSRPVLQRRPDPQRERPSSQLDPPSGGQDGTGSVRPTGGVGSPTGVIRRPSRPPGRGKAGPVPPRPPNRGGIGPTPARPPSSGSVRPGRSGTPTMTGGVTRSLPSRPPGGSARPSRSRPPNGGSVRPAPSRPPGGAARPSRSRPPNAGSARPAPSRPPTAGRPAPSPSRSGGSVRRSRPPNSA